MASSPFVRLELYGGEQTRRAIRRILCDPETSESYLRSDADYIARLNGLDDGLAVLERLACSKSSGRDPRIGQMGYRAYVGGSGARWESIGRLQFYFLVDRGLRPEHVLLDVACGALRGGVLFIPYLEPGNYLGIELAADLIKVGINVELGQTLFESKRPEFVVSGAFEFSRFSKRPDFAIAQSLFTHLIKLEIRLCLENLRKVAKENTRFYATFFEVASPVRNPEKSDPHRFFRYSKGEMAEFGTSTGWHPRYIGPWQHPANQMMFEYSVA
jgi:hypothetical protein